MSESKQRLGTENCECKSLSWDFATQAKVEHNYNHDGAMFYQYSRWYCGKCNTTYKYEIIDQLSDLKKSLSQGYELGRLLHRQKIFLVIQIWCAASVATDYFLGKFMTLFVALFVVGIELYFSSMYKQDGKQNSDRTSRISKFFTKISRYFRR